MRVSSFHHEFLEYLPEVLSEGSLYISLTHRTVAHLCACGCRKEVVTPLAPTEWGLYFDGVAVSLNPSIGNWNFPCRSHYFIRGGQVCWAGNMNQAEVRRIRGISQMRREGDGKLQAGSDPRNSKAQGASGIAGLAQKVGWVNSLWARVRKLFAGS